MKDKLVMITGANAGIGKVTARELAKMGARIVMVCRSQERGQAAQSDIKAASGKYFVTKKIQPSSAESNDPAVAQRLWQISEQLTGLTPQKNL